VAQVIGQVLVMGHVWDGLGLVMWPSGAHCCQSKLWTEFLKAGAEESSRDTVLAKGSKGINRLTHFLWQLLCYSGGSLEWVGKRVCIECGG